MRAIFLAFCLGASSVAGADDLNLGPLFDRFDLTLTPGERTEVFGSLPLPGTERISTSLGHPPLVLLDA